MRRAVFTTIALLVLTGACGSGDDEATPDPATPASPTAYPQGAGPATSTQPTSTTSSTEAVDGVEGTVVRFASPDVQVDVTITDNPTTRDFLSLLPLTIPFEEFSGREKIGYLPRELNIEGSPGHDPEDGDLIYFAPWGNLGFYYNTEGIGHDDRVIHLGTYNATPEQLAGLETGEVTITVVE